MKEIKELDMNKYLVLKWEDIEKYLTPRGLKNPVLELAGIIALSRKLEGKKYNQYVVLNLDDDISIQYLHDIIHKYFNKLGKTEEFYTVKVKYIAHHLVNAILKTKDKQ